MSRRARIVLSLVFLGSLHLVVVFAGFFAPMDPTRQHRSYPWTAPRRIHWIDSRGEWHLRPFVYALAEDPENPGVWIEDVSRPVNVTFFTRDDESSTGKQDLHLIGLEDGSPLFLIGSDGLGRDQLSRFLFGGRITLAAGLVAALLSIVGGAIGGTIAGFYGRGIDELVMRVAELFLALPWLYLLFAVRSVLPLSMPQEATFLLIASIIGVIGWARTARLVRGVVLGARSRGFVLAAKGFGASDRYLIVRHVLPQLRSVLLTQASILIPHFVAAEITLSFLGLGVAEPAASWGSLLVSLRDYYVISYPWVFVPLVAIIPVFYAYMVLATAIQDPVRSE